ncbi:hypothetical protein [Streptomyces huiliensis]|uniref:hypothetical protein n=1 Tax=Streptomyces huiliensis TaxID=2876027 RepID=UPI001CBA8D94|nr:hypothetical protein [Streptomyces huiliensis]MBZ4319958.1 hypothetical protein [Streptomyces huiliensis]
MKMMSRSGVDRFLDGVDEIGKGMRKGARKGLGSKKKRGKSKNRKLQKENARQIRELTAQVSSLAGLVAQTERAAGTARPPSKPA